ncbi:zinc finger CDGSH-type domain protein (plasmid) [Scytonema sp. HK-05]|uniref:CDGSH iron-sulfur domain-containing protein n=1 Tax=Scytonema sp. HK-05 TaxID=1137095 RepID=UPI0009370CC2|nr:CDGSH iron-sulfur domain-containing protein [Scytonema sp. HK-05]OKH53632.1 cytochrome C551 [Scytonema sp. HK-05]BAY50053.1 zinc finger CDGSH-type domain protein [Scytonema sp. HK-05]
MVVNQQPNEPVIFDKKPIVIELEPGTYHWCSSGLSSNQPFCNGAHKGTGFKPIAFEITEKKRVALCACKHTGKAPFCDGSHHNL